MQPKDTQGMTKCIKEPLNLRKTCERKLLRGIAKKSSKARQI